MNDEGQMTNSKRMTKSEIGLLLHPEGMIENSPTFQRWVRRCEWTSPEGTVEIGFGISRINKPRRGDLFIDKTRFTPFFLFFGGAVLGKIDASTRNGRPSSSFELTRTAPPKNKKKNHFGSAISIDRSPLRGLLGIRHALLVTDGSSPFTFS
jgi:hypothetical protein